MNFIHRNTFTRSFGLSFARSLSFSLVHIQTQIYTEPTSTFNFYTHHRVTFSTSASLLCHNHILYMTWERTPQERNAIFSCLLHENLIHIFLYIRKNIARIGIWNEVFGGANAWHSCSRSFFLYEGVYVCMYVCNKCMAVHVFVLDEWNERRMENGEKCWERSMEKWK